MPTPRPLSLIDAELRSIRTIDDDARRQLADIATSITRGATVSQYAALCDLRDRLLLGIEARRGAVDRLLDERLRATEVPV
jgi:hypothetical protein